MKFTLIKELKQEKSMKLILTGFLSFILLYLIADILVKQSTFGLFFDAINLTLFGSQEEYIDPITQASFLEFWHIEIFFMMMILLTLSAVFARVSNKGIILVTNMLMISAITSLLSIALAFYMSNIFIHVYVLTFFIWHITAIYMILNSLWKLYD